MKPSLLDRLRRCRARRARGYTMIEVLMGLAILAVGATGVIALQKITVVGVTNGRNITVATAVAHAHLEAVRTDAVRCPPLHAIDPPREPP